jgi:hypothetical protein
MKNTGRSTVRIANNLRRHVLVLGLEHYQSKLRTLKERTSEWDRAMKEYRAAKEKLRTITK